MANVVQVITSESDSRSVVIQILHHVGESAYDEYSFIVRQTVLSEPCEPYLSPLYDDIEYAREAVKSWL